MNESAFRTELHHLFRAAGWVDVPSRNAVICPKCGTKVLPPKGKPDTLCISPNKFGFVCEEKMYGKPTGPNWDNVPAFPFSRIEPQQRRWMDWWDTWADEDPYTGLKRGGAYIGLGTRHGTAGSISNPRMAWVVPWERWKWMENILKTGAGQESLPLAVRKGMNKTVQERGYDAISMLSHWELLWETGIGWRFGDNHPLLPEGYQYRDLAELTARWKELGDEY
jgi:hypothetical protein